MSEGKNINSEIYILNQNLYNRKEIITQFLWDPCIVVLSTNHILGIILISKAKTFNLFIIYYSPVSIENSVHCQYCYILSVTRTCQERGKAKLTAMFFRKLNLDSFLPCNLLVLTISATDNFPQRTKLIYQLIFPSFHYNNDRLFSCPCGTKLATNIFTLGCVRNSYSMSFNGS